MARVRTGGAKRWKDRSSIAGEAYVAGIQNPRVDWAQATAASAAAWGQGVQAAISNKSFEKGVQKAGSARQISRAVAVGRDRFIEGVNLGESAYSAGIAPYLQVIENLTLPPRYAKGDPRNLKRVEAVTVALRQKKLAGG